MTIKVTMPRLGLTMENGVVVRWLKKPGDVVNQGEPLLEIETDKSVVEMESPATGVLRRIVVEEGREVPVGTVIGLMTATADEPLDEEAEPEAPPAPEPAAAATVLPAPDGPSPAASTPEGPAEGPRVTPAARRRARELGVDLSRVVGTGPGGRIRVEDVEKAAAAASVGEAAPAGPVVPAGAPAGVGSAGQRVELSKMRQAIARQMTLSQQTVPQFSVGRHLDMRGPLQVYRALAESLKRHSGVRLTLTDMIIQAVARTLLRHPYLNASYEEEGGKGWLRLHGQVNLGIAVALEQGLIVPVLWDADKLSLVEIARRRSELVEKAKEQRLTPEEASGSTFTLSNLGPMDVDFFTAIVNPPEAAILATGRVYHMAVAEEGGLVSRPTMTAILSVDHRVADGVQAAAFLQDLYRFLTDGDWYLF